MSSTKQGSVLCVDDEPSILRSLQWLLQKDFDVTTAVGGEEGLLAVKDNDFDVVLSDQRMPGMTGAQLLSQVKDISPRSMRLLLTGYSDMQALLSSVNEGEIWQFVKKPWDNDELKSLLTTAAHIARNSPAATLTPLSEEVGSDNVLLISEDEDVYQSLVDNLGKNIRLLRATTMAQAVGFLAHEYIGTIVSEAKVGTTDVTGFLTLVKQKRPEIVSVVVADNTDTEQLIRLINRGQLYRFASKPLRKGYLPFLVRNAIEKHGQLVAAPLMRARYTAAAVDANLEQTLMQELGLHKKAEHVGKAGQTAQSPSSQESGFLSKFYVGFVKLFGRS